MLKYDTALYILKLFHLNEEDFEKEKEILSLKFGGDPSIYDVTWSILNKLILTIDSWNLKNVYQQMAIVCDATNNDPFPFLYKENELFLKQLLELGIYPNVKIMCLITDCKDGKKLHNKKFKTEDALKLMPIPSKTCTHKVMGKYFYCICSYIALSKGEK